MLRKERGLRQVRRTDTGPEFLGETFTAWAKDAGMAIQYIRHEYFKELVISDRDATVQAIGETLLILQRFEKILVAVLLTSVAPTEVDLELQKILLRDKETLGRLLEYFSQRHELPSNFAESFDSPLQRRNIFIHNLIMES